MQRSANMVKPLGNLFDFTLLLTSKPVCYAAPSFLGDPYAATSFDGGLCSQNIR